MVQCSRYERKNIYTIKNKNKKGSTKEKYGVYNGKYGIYNAKCVMNETLILSAVPFLFYHFGALQPHTLTDLPADVT